MIIEKALLSKVGEVLFFVLLTFVVPFYFKCQCAFQCIINRSTKAKEEEQARVERLRKSLYKCELDSANQVLRILYR